jgi:hypothetical protein
MTADKRQFPRIDTNLLVSYELMDATVGFGEGPTDEGVAQALDISLLGIRLKMTRKPESNKRIRLLVKVDDELVPVEGNVTRIVDLEDGCDVGVALTYMDDKFVEAVEEKQDASDQ